VSDHRLAAARGAAWLALALAVVSVALTLPDTWRWLSDQREELSDLTSAERAEIAGFNNQLPVAAFNHFRANLRRGDRFYVYARPGTSVRGVDFPTAARTFARYYLLPATIVDDPRDATAVVAIGRDPAELGLSYSTVIPGEGGGYTFARVRDPE
jgi:hypothetical protein